MKSKISQAKLKYKPIKKTNRKDKFLPHCNLNGAYWKKKCVTGKSKSTGKRFKMLTSKMQEYQKELDKKNSVFTVGDLRRIARQAAGGSIYYKKELWTLMDQELEVHFPTIKFLGLNHMHMKVQIYNKLFHVILAEYLRENDARLHDQYDLFSTTDNNAKHLSIIRRIDLMPKVSYHAEDRQMVMDFKLEVTGYGPVSLRGYLKVPKEFIMANEDVASILKPCPIQPEPVLAIDTTDFEATGSVKLYIGCTVLIDVEGCPEFDLETTRRIPPKPKHDPETASTMMDNQNSPSSSRKSKPKKDNAKLLRAAGHGQCKLAHCRFGCICESLTAEWALCIYCKKTYVEKFGPRCCCKGVNMDYGHWDDAPSPVRELLPSTLRSESLRLKMQQ